jgi:hypothetical protein
MTSIVDEAKTGVNLEESKGVDDDKLDCLPILFSHDNWILAVSTKTNVLSGRDDFSVFLTGKEVQSVFGYKYDGEITGRNLVGTKDLKTRCVEDPRYLLSFISKGYCGIAKSSSDATRLSFTIKKTASPDVVDLIIVCKESEDSEDDVLECAFELTRTESLVRENLRRVKNTIKEMKELKEHMARSRVEKRQAAILLFAVFIWVLSWLSVVGPTINIPNRLVVKESEYLRIGVDYLPVISGVLMWIFLYVCAPDNFPGTFRLDDISDELISRLDTYFFHDPEKRSITVNF